MTEGNDPKAGGSADTADLESYGRYRVPRPEPGPAADVELHEVHIGTRPGTRYYRLTPVRQQKLRRLAPGYLEATEAGSRPADTLGRAWRDFKRLLVGAPLASSRLATERLTKVKALAIFSSDALSSTAYATEEILLILVLAGTSALTWSLPIAAAIAALLIIVATSYRQTVRAYPNGGGSYIVAKENLGTVPGLVAGGALTIDYVLTVAVSTAAGVAAITSAIPSLHGARLEIAVVVVAFLILGNLRGIRESGSIFAIPTYFFIFAFGATIVVGFVRLLTGHYGAPPSQGAEVDVVEGLSLFLILRAFSSGSAALTGIEAIANGVPSFKAPEPKNAAVTLAWMAGILASFFVGLTVLAHQFQVVPIADETVPSQVARVTFGTTPMYYIVQVATALILVLASNTSFNGLPALASVMARDRFLPRQFAFRGDRLAYSNGIIVLGVAAIGLLLLYGADTHRLIPLYAVGVFVSFTLSQSGMVVHWRRAREPGWKRAAAINAVGAVATAVVAVIIAATKFTHGAWIVVLAIPVLVTIFYRIHSHYQDVREMLAVDTALPLALHGTVEHREQQAVVPVDEINRAVVRTLAYARAISHNITALHVTDDPEEAEALRREWDWQIPDVPLIIVESPYRSLVEPVLAYIDALDRRRPGSMITVVLPEYLPPHFWQRWLHNQSAARLKKALSSRPNTVVVDVPYHLRRAPARRSERAATGDSQSPAS